MTSDETMHVRHRDTLSMCVESFRDDSERFKCSVKQNIFHFSTENRSGNAFFLPAVSATLRSKEDGTTGCQIQSEALDL